MIHHLKHCSHALKRRLGLGYADIFFIMSKAVYRRSCMSIYDNFYNVSYHICQKNQKGMEVAIPAVK